MNEIKCLDVGRLTAEVSREDGELLGMFRQRRELDHMVMIAAGDRLWLMTKPELEAMKKRNRAERREWETEQVILEQRRERRCRAGAGAVLAGIAAACGLCAGHLITNPGVILTLATALVIGCTVAGERWKRKIEQRR